MVGWLFRQVDFAGVTTPIFRLPLRPSESYDYILNRIQARYFSNERDPSSFDRVQWRLVPRTQESALSEIPLVITSTLNPGLYDVTAPATRPKSIYYKSPKIDLAVFAFEVFYLEFEGHSATNTGLLDLLFIGGFTLTEPVRR